ncbi:MAG: DUF11 domain-containing protein [Candidatus Krumholzibacteria bacterium]
MSWVFRHIARRTAARGVLVGLSTMLFLAAVVRPVPAQVGGAVVDAWIDGNGDNIYGAVGTGAGGTSSQTVVAGGGLDFILRLENEGGRADDFVVTWNTIPGLTATMQGGPQPFTSDKIPPPNFRDYTFHVDAPFGTPPGVYIYTIDVVSNRDPTVGESVTAIVTVLAPPRVDLVIDGDGLGVFGTLGSGQGGVSLHAANPGTNYTASLEVWNVGEIADSFQVTWQIPAGWPAGSVLISDGVTDYSAPFWTPLIGGGASLNYTVKVQVPVGVGAGQFSTIIDAFSSMLPNDPESVELVTQTAAVVTGTVFEDFNHDGALTAGEPGLGGVTVNELVGGLLQVTAGDGSYTFLVTGGTSVLVNEQNPSGFLSISPDSVGPVALNAGDTIQIDFADVAPLTISPGSVLTGSAGSFVDFPHLITVGTQGQVVVTVTTDSSTVTTLFLDENGNGILDGIDRPLVASDLDMDPASGKSAVSILVRVFVPITMTLGSTFNVTVDASQVISDTPLTTSAQAVDIVVVANQVLTLLKSVDIAAAAPGDVVTYTISFTNSGADSLQNIVISDLMSPFVDPMPDAFGPGQDVEWVRGGLPTLYLTLDPADGDEGEYDAGTRLLQVLFSKNLPFFLPPGAGGTISYKVIVR